MTSRVFIPIGLNCPVPWGIRDAGLRVKSYPFDYNWVPASAAYEVLRRLIHDTTESAVEYMTTGYTYYDFLGFGTYVSSKNKVTTCLMNKITGIGITHFKVNDEYKQKLKVRCQRLITDVTESENPILIYADTVTEGMNYSLDGVFYDHDVYESLLKIYDLIIALNKNTKIYYFCRPNRYRDCDKILHISNRECQVDKVICEYLTQEMLQSSASSKES